jgi:hypothetical protein
MFKKNILLLLLCLFSTNGFAKTNNKDSVLINIKPREPNYIKCLVMEQYTFSTLFKDCIDTSYAAGELTVGDCNLISRQASTSFYHGCIIGKL